MKPEISNPKGENDEGMNQGLSIMFIFLSFFGFGFLRIISLKTQFLRYFWV